jgi:phospholipid transport system transporter-binding protein
MMPLTLTTRSTGLLELAGDLTFATINKKTVLLCDFNALSSDIIIDFSHINNSDSAGLALLIEWLKLSQAAQRQLKFRHLPEQLHTLAKLCGFDMQPFFAEIS